MSQRTSCTRFLVLLGSLALLPPNSTAQEPSPPAAEPATPTSITSPAVQAQSDSKQLLTVPVGTHLSLLLQNGINTRTAKLGDPVYFQTTFPIAQDNRIVIPMGTFVRGEVVAVKRPGRLKGRAELQMRIISLTFSNGYVASFAAIPDTLDSVATDGIDNGGKIKGPSGVAKDVGTVAMTTGGGLLLGTYGGAVGGIATNSARAFSTGVLAGGGAGLAAGLLTVALTRGPDLFLRPGTRLDAIFDRPLQLDAAHLPSNDPGTAVFPPAAPAEDLPHHRQCRHGLLGFPNSCP